MTRDEALTIMGLSEKFSEDGLTQNYHALYNDLHLRLTHAPTPNLKKLYNRNIQELNNAYNLLSGIPVDTNTADLPAREPVFGKTQTTEPMQRVVKNSGQASSILHQNTTSSDKIEAKLNRIRRAFNIALALTIVVISACVLVLIMWADDRKTTKELNGYKEKFEQVSMENQRLSQKSKLLTNGKFRIKNYGDSELTLQWLIVVSIDETGKAVKYEKYLNQVIRPGGTANFKDVQGSTVTWNGDAVAYSCGFFYKNKKWAQGGMWQADKNEEDNLAINLNR